MRWHWFLVFPLLLVFSGCHRPFLGTKGGLQYKTVTDRLQYDTEKARRLNAKAADIICRCHDPCSHSTPCECCEAEQLLKDALTADVTFGPAHNNLGKVYFHQNKHYLAAWEFEYAVKQMPDRYEPLNNLGLVHESVGKLDEAIDYFLQATMLSPRAAQPLGNLIRARMRRGEGIDDVDYLLKQLVLLDDRCAWTDWAREQVALRKRKRNYPEEQFKGAGLQAEFVGVDSQQLSVSSEFKEGGMEAADGYPVPVPNAPIRIEGAYETSIDSGIQLTIPSVSP
jgi:tetratricopeptide (TPR) repeat protein